MKEAASPASTRTHDMRIAVQSALAPGSSIAVTEILIAWLGTWQAAPLFNEHDVPAEQADIWLISAQVPEEVGSSGYARRAHAAVQDLLGVAGISRAEADIPVRAFIGTEPGAAPYEIGNSPPGSEESWWARDVMRCAEAWALPPDPGGASRGRGIVVGHPDTGYTLHPNLGVAALDLARDWDFIDDDDDALDPLLPPDESPWPLALPGHGTATASVIAGRGSEAAGIVGVAPEATLIPLRTVESVVQLFDSDVARGVDYARARGAHVISISLGGKGFFGLRAAIQRAVDAGAIVIAAAGNNVGIVVAPASYSNCLAVAATGPDDRPWPESSRGPAVDLSAPGWGVHVADVSWQNGRAVFEVQQTSGTSYSAAHLAGVAALWLAHHGADALRNRYGAELQAVFLHLLRSGGCRVPTGWDASQWGAGVPDAAALLTLPLPPTAVAPSLRPGDGERPISRLSALIGVDDAVLERALARRLGGSVDELQRTLARFEGELAFHLVRDRAFLAALLGDGAADSAAGSRETLASCSPQFAAAFL